MNIITHNGSFHADEIVAISLLKIFCPNNWIIIRTRDTAIINSHIENPLSYVIDVGTLFNPILLAFDHHQDAQLPASNIMIFNWLLNNGKIEQTLYDELLPFMMGVSNIDTNANGILQKWSQFNENHTYRTFSDIIAGFNTNEPSDEIGQDYAFKLAIQCCISVLNNEIRSAQSRMKAYITYENREVLPNGIAVFSEFCPVWKSKKDHNWAILPNPQGWSLNTADSSKWPLPFEETVLETLKEAGLEDHFIFLHKGLFIAIFTSKDAAVLVSQLYNY